MVMLGGSVAGGSLMATYLTNSFFSSVNKSIKMREVH